MHDVRLSVRTVKRFPRVTTRGECCIACQRQGQQTTALSLWSCVQQHHVSRVSKIHLNPRNGIHNDIIITIFVLEVLIVLIRSDTIALTIVFVGGCVDYASSYDSLFLSLTLWMYLERSSPLRCPLPVLETTTQNSVAYLISLI